MIVLPPNIFKETKLNSSLDELLIQLVENLYRDIKFCQLYFKIIDAEFPISKATIHKNLYQLNKENYQSNYTDIIYIVEVFKDYLESHPENINIESNNELLNSYLSKYYNIKHKSIIDKFSYTGSIALYYANLTNINNKDSFNKDTSNLVKDIKSLVSNELINYTKSILHRGLNVKINRQRSAFSSNTEIPINIVVVFPITDYKISFTESFRDILIDSDHPYIDENMEKLKLGLSISDVNWEGF